ncbi:MAG: helix-turn-helix transcriptional regulator [Chitinophagaceae bacterium]
MRIKNLLPNEAVAEYVERILIIENAQSSVPFSLPLFANGSPTLLFNSAKGIMRNILSAHLALFGQTITPDKITFTGGFTLVAYFFKPYSLTTIFKVSPYELTDKPIDLDLVSPKKTILLQDQLLNANTTEDMIALINSYIVSLVANSKNDCAAIKYAATKIASDPSGKMLTSLQKELFISERTFQRQFEKNIGIPPSLYRRIYQFNNGFQQLNNRKFNKLSDIAFQNGYADQSHYIRSFKEFTNLTPKDYLNFGSQP